MRYKYLVIVIFLLLPFSFSLGQTLELRGQEITFGATLSEQKNNFWREGAQIKSKYSYIDIYVCDNTGQVESDFPYTEAYEGEIINGEFYKKHLVTLNVKMLSINVYPEIENLLKNVKPYNQYTVFNEVEILIEVFQTSDYYISRESNSTIPEEYTIVPIKVLENIRSKHPEYLSKLF